MLTTLHRIQSSGIDNSLSSCRSLAHGCSFVAPTSHVCNSNEHLDYYCISKIDTHVVPVTE